jgi:NADH dehydrogenase
MAKKNVVVLGAGFGGLRAAMDAAKELRKLDLQDKYEVVLVDRTDCHLYTPLLYTATAPMGTYNANTCTYDISSLIKNTAIRFIQSEVVGIDLPNGVVRLATGEELKAEFLVLALGSETNYFGIPGLKENSLQLKTLEQALAIKDAATKTFAKSGDAKIFVGGGGANGTELAAELRLWANLAEAKDKNLHATVTILEAMPTILPGLDPRVIALAAKRLTKLGVVIKTGAKITGVSSTDIAIEGSDKLSFDVFVWTGGIRTPDMITQLPLQKESHGKPMAEESMACLPATPDLKLYSMVYAIGDSVCFMNPETKRPVPAVARAAIGQGSIAARNVIEEIKKAERKNYAPKYRTYKPWNYPYVIPIGDPWAVAKAGPFAFSGWPAALFKDIIELNYLLSVMPFSTAIRTWLA